jgi:hypothetical protein
MPVARGSLSVVKYKVLFAEDKAFYISAVDTTTAATEQTKKQEKLIRMNRAGDSWNMRVTRQEI